MLKITEQTPDQLVMEKIPVAFYVAGTLLGVLGGAACLFLLRASTLTLFLGISVILLSLVLVVFGIHGTRVVIRKSKKAVYYIKKSLAINRVKKYYFFEIRDCRLSQDDPHSEAAQDSGKYDIILEKSTGQQKVLFHNHPLRQAREAKELISHYLELQ